MGTNHLAHFLLTLGLLPALRRGAADPAALKRLGGARVVHVSSSMLMFGGGLAPSNPDPCFEAAGSYSAEEAYGRSKLAQVLFTRELRRRLALSERPGPKAAAGKKGGRGGGGGGSDDAPPSIQVFAVHPGYVMTNVVRTLPEVVQAAYKLLMTPIMLTPEQGEAAGLLADRLVGGLAGCFGVG
jgi:retinol dehydrogenase-12